MVDERNIHTKQDFEEHYSGRSWRDYRYLLSACIAYGEPGKILDIGAGMGCFVECCLKFGIECVGIEGSEFAVEHARQRGVELVHLVLEKGTELPFNNGVFSLVVSNQTAHHLHPDVAMDMFRESFRVLREGGIFIAYEGSLYNKEERKHSSHINLFTPSRLRSELTEVGFNIIAEPNQFVGSTVFSRTLRRIIYRFKKVEPFLNTANAIGRKQRKV